MIPLIPVLPRATFGGAPVVSNVVAVQRTTMGGEVDITYDLTDTDGDACTITVEIITPEGAIIRPQLLSGHAGTGVTPGTGKHIVWDAMRDQPGRYGTTWRARVLANDGHLGEEIQYNLPGSSVPLLLFTSRPVNSQWELPSGLIHTQYTRFIWTNIGSANMRSRWLNGVSLQLPMAFRCPLQVVSTQITPVTRSMTITRL